jgi:hypothetical protein
LSSFSVVHRRFGTSPARLRLPVEIRTNIEHNVPMVAVQGPRMDVRRKDIEMRNNTYYSAL